MSRIKYYVLSVVGFLGVYTWTGTRGISFYGDDNIHKEEKGQRHAGGHGVYYHK